MSRRVFLVGGANTPFVGKGHPDFIWKNHPEFGKRDNPGLEETLQSAVEACFASRDYKEGQAAFLEKRKPRFTGT